MYVLWSTTDGAAVAKVKLPGISGRQVTVEVGENVRIHSTAKFGVGVRLIGNVRIGAHCQVGARCQLENTTLDARVVLGERVWLINTDISTRSTIDAGGYVHNSRIENNVTVGLQAWFSNALIEPMTTIGARCRIDASYEAPINSAMVSHAVLGDNVQIQGNVTVGSRVADIPTTTIGDFTTIGSIDDRPTIIAEWVQIGNHSGIAGSIIGRSSQIGSRTEITCATLGVRTRVGNNVTIQPNVNILDDWLIPNNVIVNYHPNAPVVIPKTRES